MKEFARYAVVVAGYIVLAMFTKHYLTWTYGPIYFIVMLEVIPRIFGRIRHWVRRQHELTPTVARDS
jgi:hypothetical protein